MGRGACCLCGYTVAGDLWPEGNAHARSQSPSGMGAAISGNVVITFSEPMDTAIAGTVQLNSLTALTGGTWSNGDTVFTVSYSGLSYNTAYTINISGFADVAGNTMVADSTRSFTTMNEPTYALTVINGTDTTNAGPYTAGTIVTITANAAPAGQVFDKWVLTSGGGVFANANSVITTFTMSNSAATVTATYKTLIQYPVTAHFGTWSGSGHATGKVDADHSKFVRLLLGGVVERVEGNVVHTIEGNSSDMVRRKSYPLNSSYIYGYGVPNY